MIAYLIDKIYVNSYALVIGRFYTPELVGYYNRATAFANYASVNCLALLNRVYYPLLCEQQNNDNNFEEIFHKYISFSSYVIVPICLGMAAIGEPLIEVLLSHKWAGAIWPMKILLWAGALNPLMTINCQPIQARKRSDLLLAAECIKKSIAVIIMMIAIKYGLIVLCCSVLLYNIIDIFLIIFFCKKVLSTGYLQQFKLILPIFFSAIVMELTIVLLFEVVSMPYWLQLLVAIPLGIFIYIGLSYVLKIPAFWICLNYLRQRQTKSQLMS